MTTPLHPSVILRLKKAALADLEELVQEHDAAIKAEDTERKKHDGYVCATESLILRSKDTAEGIYEILMRHMVFTTRLQETLQEAAREFYCCDSLATSNVAGSPCPDESAHKGHEKLHEGLRRLQQNVLDYEELHKDTP